ETLRHPANGTPVKLNHFATCDTSYVIYMLKCPCGLAYIGQTIRAVKTRIKEHKGSIRNFKKGAANDTTVSRHFNVANHNQSQLRWAILEVVNPMQRGGNLRKKLSQREAYWIKKLDTLYPKDNRITEPKIVTLYVQLV
ncbi:hypothetical protein XELAEV_18021259mg, partial [Xenopus laevis]